MFGLQGERAALLADDTGMGRLLQMRREFQKMPGVDKAQGTLMQSFLGRESYAWSNFQAIATEVGEQALPGLTKGFKDLGDSFHEGQVWLHKNKRFEKDIENAITGGVKGAEDYLVKHRQDLKNIGNDIVTVAGDMKLLGPALLQAADGAIVLRDNFMWLTSGGIAIRNAVEGVEDWFQEHSPFSRNEPQIGVGRDGKPIYSSDPYYLTHHVIGFDRSGKPMFAASSNPRGGVLGGANGPAPTIAPRHGNEPVGPTVKALQASLRTRTREVSTVVNIAQGAIVINGSQDPKKTADEVLGHLHRKLRLSGRRRGHSVQNAAAQTGSIATHPLMPRPLSTPP